MEIKNVIFAGCFWGLLSMCCNAQKTTFTNYSDDSTRFDKRLPEYQVSTCLSNFLVSVVKFNARYYNSSKFFYSLTFNKGVNKKYMNIAPEEWRSAKSVDYTGVIKIRNVMFLCRGDFTSEPLFKKKPSSLIRIKIEQSKDSSDLIPFTKEPSLDGVFNDCRGTTIYVEVYTKGRISGYERKIYPAGIKREK